MFLVQSKPLGNGRHWCHLCEFVDILHGDHCGKEMFAIILEKAPGSTTWTGHHHIDYEPFAVVPCGTKVKKAGCVAEPGEVRTFQNIQQHYHKPACKHHLSRLGMGTRSEKTFSNWQSRTNMLEQIHWNSLETHSLGQCAEMRISFR